MIELLILYKLSKKVLTMYGISKDIHDSFSPLCDYKRLFHFYNIPYEHSKSKTISSCRQAVGKDFHGVAF